MRHGTEVALRAVCLLLAFGGCTRPAFLVLHIEDPTEAATSFESLHVGPSRDTLSRVEVDVSSFPVAVTVTAAKTGERELWAEARSADDVPLACGSTAVRFASKGSPTATLQLARACNSDGACNAGSYCTATAQCLDGMCASAGPPCVSNFACVLMTCVELDDGEGTCSLTVDHALCAQGSYCDPGGGCVEGPRCMEDAECDDGAVCNGVEICNRFRCEGGLAPIVDDGDICTLDGCDDGRADQGLEPIFHAEQATLDGSACVIPDTGDPGTAGVCVAAKGGCVASECGDGIIDAATSEVCDQGALNSDDWQLDPQCKTDCSGFAPFCGDNQLDAGHETCDDGARFDSGNGCSDQCQRNDGGCGDGVVQSLFEACDDQNSDECDGCLSDCSFGCVCGAPGACLGATWCDQGQCVACDVTSHCGPSCEACADATPLCGGAVAGCACDPDPAPHGSCPPSTLCDAGGTCVGCNDAQLCGQECLACGGDTPACGGFEVGCIVDPPDDCSGKPDFTLCQVTTTPDRSYDICLDEVCVSPGCGDASCNPSGPSFARADMEPGWEYPDTGQRLCYYMLSTVCSSFPCQGNGGPDGCGQDAQYGWDSTHPDPAARWTETSAAEPVVTDNVTSIMWQKCVSGFSGADCTSGGTVVKNWADALEYCDQLTWGGFADWRLPDYHELTSVIPLGYFTSGVFDPSFFPGPTTDNFWSSSREAATSNRAWYASGDFGGVGVELTSALMHVRCVRMASSARSLLPRYSRSEPVAGEPVVTDVRTNHIWQGCLAGHVGDLTTCSGTLETYAWSDALNYCEGLRWAGSSDWRLPNRAELMSIIDPATYAPAVDATAFPDLASGFVLHSSSAHGNLGPTFGWRVATGYGFANWGHRDDLLAVMCLRTEP